MTVWLRGNVTEHTSEAARVDVDVEQMYERRPQPLCPTLCTLSIRNCRAGLVITPPPVGGRGIVFGRFLSFFLSLSLCQQHYEKTAGLICMKFSGKMWSDHGTT